MKKQPSIGIALGCYVLYLDIVIIWFYAGWVRLNIADSQVDFLKILVSDLYD